MTKRTPGHWRLLHRVSTPALAARAAGRVIAAAFGLLGLVMVAFLAADGRREWDTDAILGAGVVVLFAVMAFHSLFRRRPGEVTRTGAVTKIGWEHFSEGSGLMLHVGSESWEIPGRLERELHPGHVVKLTARDGELLALWRRESH